MQQGHGLGVKFGVAGGNAELAAVACLVAGEHGLGAGGERGDISRSKRDEALGGEHFVLAEVRCAEGGKWDFSGLAGAEKGRSQLKVALAGMAPGGENARL